MSQYHGGSATNFWAPYVCTFLALFILTEIAFLAYVKLHLYPRLAPLNKPPQSALAPNVFIGRVLQHIVCLKSYDKREFFSGFFLGAKLEDIRTGNMRSFLSWAMHSSAFEDLQDHEKDVIEETVCKISKECDITFEEGYNPCVDHISMTLNPIQYIHRPFFLYLGSFLKNLLGDVVFLMYGFKRGELGRCRYWVRNSNDLSKSPMLFFHGISTGWIFYLRLIVNISRGRALLLIDLDTIKINSLSFDMPDEEEFVKTVHDICTSHFGRGQKISVVGHSFGTILAAWFLRAYPVMISHLTLLDPVSLLLGLPDVAYNFLHKEPTTFSASVIRLMASRELTVANMLHRHFWWYNNILWLEDIPPALNMVVGLAGLDEITNPELIMEYINIFNQSHLHDHDLAQHARGRTGHIRTLYWPDKTHAAILLDSTAQHEIYKAILDNEADYVIS